LPTVNVAFRVAMLLLFLLHEKGLAQAHALACAVFRGLPDSFCSILTLQPAHYRY
jgi:hypothetical protein